MKSTWTPEEEGPATGKCKGGHALILLHLVPWMSHEKMEVKKVGGLSEDTQSQAVASSQGLGLGSPLLRPPTRTRS
jgi:hypothetical protein